MQKKILVILTLVIHLSLISYSQDQGIIVETVTGRVVNASSNEPVSYTNIGIEGTFYGTASNDEGYFELKIPEEMAEKEIYFSAVGYKNKQFPVSHLFEKEFNVVKIEPQSYDIEDVDIEAQNRVLIRILRMASENIPFNFIQGPFNLTGSYESERITSDTATIYSAVVTIYDKNGYKSPSKRDAYKSLNYQIASDSAKEAYSFPDGTTNLDELLELDWVRTASSVLNPGIVSGFKLGMKDQPVIDGKNCWVIAFSTNQPTLSSTGDYYSTRFEGEITVNKNDYSVLKIEGSMHSAKNSIQGKSLAISDSNQDYLANVQSRYSIVYKNLKPDVITLEKSFTYKGAEIRERSSLQITQVQAVDVSPLESRQYFTGN